MFENLSANVVDLDMEQNDAYRVSLDKVVEKISEGDVEKYEKILEKVQGEIDKMKESGFEAKMIKVVEEDPRYSQYAELRAKVEEGLKEAIASGDGSVLDVALLQESSVLYDLKEDMLKNSTKTEFQREYKKWNILHYFSEAANIRIKDIKEPGWSGVKV